MLGLPSEGSPGSEQRGETAYYSAEGRARILPITALHGSEERPSWRAGQSPWQWYKETSLALYGECQEVLRL